MERMRFWLATGSPREALTEQQLRRLLREYAVWDWIFTYDIRIETRVIPHSHPTLTLNTRYLDDDDRLMATFVHEQLPLGRPDAGRRADHPTRAALPRPAD
jgi:hypothetical protein